MYKQNNVLNTLGKLVFGKGNVINHFAIYFIISVNLFIIQPVPNMGLKYFNVITDKMHSEYG
jgi:hypothetical protein